MYDMEHELKGLSLQAVEYFREIKKKKKNIHV